jgi:hypothetical protein
MRANRTNDLFTLANAVPLPRCRPATLPSHRINDNGLDVFPEYLQRAGTR